MADAIRDELDSLEKEFRWLITEEVNTVIQQLKNILLECSRRLPVSSQKMESLIRAEKFLMSNTPQHHLGVSDQVKCVVTLAADNILQADLSIRLHKQPSPHRTMVQSDQPWNLQQIQDSGNHLWQALDIVSNLTSDFKCASFHSSEYVTQILSNIISCLQRGRASLLFPKKKTIEEIMNSRNMKLLHPQLPSDIAVSFYIQSHKLVFAVYHIHRDHGQIKFEVYNAETSIPWLNEVLVFYTIALQLCQRMKDKVAAFSQYKEITESSSL